MYCRNVFTSHGMSGELILLFHSVLIPKIRLVDQNLRNIKMRTKLSIRFKSPKLETLYIFVYDKIFR